MIEYDLQYKRVLQDIMANGVDVDDRTGTGCRKIFDTKISVDLRGDKNHYHLPVGSLRKIYPRTAFIELLWMLRGSTDANELKEKNIKIWDANSSRSFLDSRGLSYLREGFIGPKAYGYQFRNWNGHYDQLTATIEGIIKEPNSRRHMISLWNPSDFAEQALPPCHHLYTFVVTGGVLNLKFTQRSSDFILAGNTNMLFASFFLIFMANWTGLKAGKVVQDIADCHIYHNLFEAAEHIINAQTYDRVWRIPKKDGLWNRYFSDDTLDEMFIGDSMYNEMVKEHNMDVIDITNPPLPKHMLRISA